MSNLYETIHGLCVKRGITDGKMCKELNLSRGLTTDLKMGRKKGLSAEIANKIASYFGVTVDYLLHGGQNEAAPADEAEADDEMANILQDFRDNPELRTLFSLFRNATPEELRQYADVIKALRRNRD
jgi:transcriptional regulator with XRE-family HTH domain